MVSETGRDGAVERFSCENCGATTSFDPGTTSLRCPFCGSQLVVRATGAAADAAVDRYVLPFKIQREDSQRLIREWLGSSIFAPGDLKSRSALDRGQGSYIPFWRFDAEASSDWEGEISRTHTRQVPRTRTGSDGKSERYMATETYKTWHPRSGHHQATHRAWAPGSTGLTRSESDALMPFPEEAMMTFSSDLLAGFSAEEPGIDEAGAWVIGEQLVRDMEREACAREVERLTRVDSEIGEPETALVYLPIWIYGYRYKNQDFRVLVNGATGEVVGERPVSRARVAIAIGAAVVIIVIVVVVILLTR